MISQIELCFQHRRLIFGHRRFSFTRGFNVVVGPNGSGKSILLEAVYKCRKCKRQTDRLNRYHYFNGETMNPHRTHKYFKGWSGSVLRVRALFSSHGETMRDVLRSYHPHQGDCFILDEPETGHDLEWLMRIRKALNALVKADCQVIVATHHPVFTGGAHHIELRRNYLRKMCREIKKQIAGCHKSK